MTCNPVTDLAGCLRPAAGGQASLVSPGWDAICESFAKAAQQLLGSFARSFFSVPPISLSYASIRSVYGLSLEIAALVATALLMVQVIRTVLTHDGSAIAQGLVGVGKAALAFVLTLTAAATALRAADELTRWIIVRSFGSQGGLSARLAKLATFDPSVSASLTLILALLAIVLTIALWAQLLARNVAVTVLVAVAPMAAAGQVGYGTQQWWRKLVRTTIQLIALKPAVALIFAVGLMMPALPGALQRLLAGMLVLLLAGCAWPVMARAAAVLDVQVTGGMLAGSRGHGRAGGTQAGPPSGVDPAELSRVAEARTMAAVHELRVGAAGATMTAGAVPAAGARLELTGSGPLGLPGRPDAGQDQAAPAAAATVPADAAAVPLTTVDVATAQFAMAEVATTRSDR
jgi:hypothetical protein